MKTEFTGSFLRDVRKLPNGAIREQVDGAMLTVEAAPDLRSVSNLKKLSGSGSYYRIRVGEYRIGLSIKDDVVTFVRVLPRKDIYRYFP
ncbi:MAG TPA: type II toxin-antitoxin system RelE/ParE family toxin [Longimicrobium sp.]|nr:type II toxin-antitoxin system RelE/ParE family toxin [Longimicrobium sp.]